MAVAFWEKDWLITCVDRSFDKLRIEEMKATVENDVVLKVKKSMVS